ncbi:hypothetical protein A4A49_21984 [Nicotiana attenuata]|uniref:Uncharacterized protein n=1 Tax=Nicotiana attenuata TaxID=49451 RepID=A0A1J6HSF3_NICAT|nr:hypothetical protein A4A49_21984 [Nicotiana attenuata]
MKPLWSDEVEIMEYQTSTNTSATLEENMNDKQGKAAGAKNPSATVKPNLLETRVKVPQPPNNQQPNIPAGGASGEPKECNSSGKSAEDDLANAQANATVNPRGTVGVLATVEGVLVEISGDDQLENVPTKVFNDTVWLDKETVDRELGDLSGTVFPVLSATVNPSLGSIDDLQFKMLEHSLGTGDQCEMVMKENNGEESQHPMVPHVASTIETSLMACVSGTGHPMQIQLNVPIKSPI